MISFSWLQIKVFVNSNTPRILQPVSKFPSPSFPSLSRWLCFFFFFLDKWSCLVYAWHLETMLVKRIVTKYFEHVTQPLKNMRRTLSTKKLYLGLLVVFGSLKIVLALRFDNLYNGPGNSIPFRFPQMSKLHHSPRVGPSTQNSFARE